MTTPDLYDPYVELASEIVLRNINDYISTYKRYQKRRMEKDLYILKDLERWFYSDRFKLYCSIHPDVIMKAIKRRLNEDSNKKEI